MPYVTPTERALSVCHGIDGWPSTLPQQFHASQHVIVVGPMYGRDKNNQSDPDLSILDT